MDWSMVFAVFSIVFAALNLLFAFMGKDSKVFMFASLSLTILAVYAAYANDLRIIKSMGFDRDIMSSYIFVDASLVSIAVNGLGLFFGRRKRK